MSDTDAPENNLEQAGEAENQPTTDKVTDWQAEAEKWKSLSRKHEATAKLNADKAKAFDDAEEAFKSELQKLQDQLAAAENDAATASLELLRARVANEKGVPAQLLTGTTEDEIMASADALIAFRGPTATPPPANGVLGNVGKPIGGGNAQKSRADLQNMTPEQIEDARLAGELDDLLAGRTT